MLWHSKVIADFVKSVFSLVQEGGNFLAETVANWTPNVIWTLKQIRFEQIHVIYQSKLHKYFKMKKKYTCHMPLWLTAIVCATIINSHIYWYIGARHVGCGWKLWTSKREGLGNPKVLENFHSLYSNWITPRYPFLPAFFIFKQSLVTT